jgi:hypothetical protein
MSATRGDAARAMWAAGTAAVSLLLAERRLPAPAATQAVNRAEIEFIHAALDFAEVYAAMDPAEMPKSWRRDPERRAS